MAIAIGQRTSIGERPHWVTFENPGEPIRVPDGGWDPGEPIVVGSAFVQIRPATGADMERVIAGTVLSHASYIVTGPWQAGLSTNSAMRFRDRRFNVMGIANLDERDVEMMLVCDEVKNVPAPPMRLASTAEVSAPTPPPAETPPPVAPTPTSSWD